jgi:hypothetical protein
MTFVSLLGPQRHEPMVKGVLDEHGLEGTVALITGGWEERETEDEILVEHLEMPTVNLQLHARLDQVLREDIPFHQALVDRNDRLRVAQILYRSRLEPTLESVRKLQRIKVPRMELVPAERADALMAVASLDAHYLSQIRAIHEAFRDIWFPASRPTIARIREQVREQIEGSVAVLIAGGHVGALIDQLTLLDLAPLIAQRPVIAWSAGAMVLTERIVLFHDHPPQGRGDTELYDDGLGLAPRVVALPHAIKRLDLTDPLRVSMLAERFQPATCVALDERCGLTWNGEAWSAFGRTRRLSTRGQVTGMAAP